jgi:D-lactate dehydrogenase (cytochrome)
MRMETWINLMKHLIGKTIIREQLSDLLTDESRCSGGIPEEVFFPESRDDVIKALETARARQLPLTIIGGRTGITGGAVPVDGCVAVSFSSMKKIRAVIKDPAENPCLVCDPGIMLSEIEVFLQDPGAWPEKVPGAELLDGVRFFYPPDPTEMTAQLGGTVATNASGARSFRFGPTRDHVQSLSVVLASGQTATISRGTCFPVDNEFVFKTDQGSVIRIAAPSYQSKAIKNASGYYARPGMDLIDLLIGSEGTLCVFSAVTIKLCKAQEFLSGLSFFPSREMAFDFAEFLRSQPQVAAIEYFDSSALQFLAAHRRQSANEVPSFPAGKNSGILWEYTEGEPVRFEEVMETWENELARCGSSFDETWSGFDDKGLKQLKVFRHELPEQINAEIARNKTIYPSIRKISTDAAVPEDSFRPALSAQIERIEKSSLPYVAFGHLGACHLHINLLPRNDTELSEALSAYHDVMAIAIENGGTVSAEHGIGKLKKAYLKMMYGDTTIEEMKAIKKAFDPEGMLNPGNLFD